MSHGDRVVGLPPGLQAIASTPDLPIAGMADTLRLADHIFIEELRRAGWYEKTSQAFAVFLPA
jgi:hypothetical protein